MGVSVNKAAFLDKDGTLIVDVPYNVDPAQVRLYDDAGPALRQLQSAGYRLIVISNQSGVARGYFAESALEAVWQSLRDQLQSYGVSLDGFYHCPHHPDGSVTKYAVDCGCRKPQPGLLRQAASEHEIDLGASWMIGDILNDVEAGNRAGCRTILVDRGNETEWLEGPFRTPTATVTNLREAVQRILNAEKAEPETQRTQRIGN